MRDRRLATLLLLGSRLDGLWLPRGSLTTPSGLAPGLVEPCPACGGVLLRDDFGHVVRRRRGRGRVLDRFGRSRVCDACVGAGVVARDRMDASGVRVGSEATSAVAPAPRTVPCDACGGDGVVRGERCVRCDGDGRRPADVFELRLDLRLEGERDAIDASLDARAASGSFAELDRALEELRVAHRGWWRGLLGAVDVGETAPLDETLEPPLRFVVERMPDPIRVPAQVVANGRELDRWRKRVRGRAVAPEALRARDVEIRRLVRRDMPVQWVAREFGLSVAQVYRVVQAA